MLAFVGIGNYRGHCVSQTHLVFTHFSLIAYNTVEVGVGDLSAGFPGFILLTSLCLRIIWENLVQEILAQDFFFTHLSLLAYDTGEVGVGDFGVGFLFPFLLTSLCLRIILEKLVQEILGLSSHPMRVAPSQSLMQPR